VRRRQEGEREGEGERRREGDRDGKKKIMNNGIG